jgi:hypothetical protein
MESGFFKIFILSFLIFSLKNNAQVNLVPNAGFEVHDTCPSVQDQAEYATGWNKCSTNNGPGFGNTTPDYYNACSPAAFLGVPQSGVLYQPDLRTCGAYMGLITYSFPTWSEYREQIGISLGSPLVIGQKYFLSVSTVLGGYKVGTDYYDHPSNNIGLRLSTITYSPSSPAPIDNFAHLRSSAIITDSVNWIRITGSIVADSAYTYLMLGNFYDDVNTDTLMYSCGTCYNSFSYYLVDNICVSTDSAFCNGGIDAVSCTVSIPEIKSDSHVKVFPNPASDFVTLLFQDNGWEEISITDIFGKRCYEEKVSDRSSVTINISFFNAGIYFLNITDQNKKQLINKKIVKL